MAEKEKTESKGIIVVSQLPKINTRILEDESGKQYDCITMEEALTELLESIREIKVKIG